MCTEAARPGGLRLREADAAMIDSLHRRGLLYLEVPIRPDDHVSIPPLEARAPRASPLRAWTLAGPSSVRVNDQSTPSAAPAFFLELP